MSINFAGDGDYVDIPDSFDALSQGTIGLWYKPNALTVWHDLFASSSYGSGQADEYLDLQIRGDGSDYVQWTSLTLGNNNLSMWPEVAVEAGVWIHICVVITGSTTLMYLNGANQTLNYESGDSSDHDFFSEQPTDQETYIARLLFNGSYFSRQQGEMQDFFICDSALTANQVKQIYSSRQKYAPTSIGGSSCVLYLPMDDGIAGSFIDGVTVKDRSGSGNDGTGADADDDSTFQSEEILSYPGGPIFATRETAAVAAVSTPQRMMVGMGT